MSELDSQIEQAAGLTNHTGLQYYVVENNHGLTVTLLPEKYNIVWPKIGWSLHKIRETIINTGEQEFGVRFVKRTTGELREMRCRLGVTDRLTPDPKRKGLEFKAYRLVGVFDLDKNEYRSIPIDGVVGLRLPGSDDWISTLEQVL